MCLSVVFCSLWYLRCCLGWFSLQIPDLSLPHHSNTHTCMHARARTHTHTETERQTDTQTESKFSTHTHTIHMHARVCAHTNTHTHTHTHTYTHTHTHTLLSPLSLPSRALARPKVTLCGWQDDKTQELTITSLTASVRQSYTLNAWYCLAIQKTDHAKLIVTGIRGEGPCAWRASKVSGSFSHRK